MARFENNNSRGTGIDPEAKLRLHEQKETHEKIKRWERSKQRQQWKRRSEGESAGSLPALFRTGEGVIVRPATLWEQFEGGWSLLSYGPASTGEPFAEPEFAVIRGGVLWNRWLPTLLQAYRWNKPVPRPFRPLRRIAPEIWERSLTLPPADLGRLLAKLRAEGFLPKLAALDPRGVGPYFPYQELPARSAEFSEAERSAALESYPG